MIQLFTASPVRFNEFNFSAVGTGTDIARHGYGMYFGSIDIAKHYLANYSDYSKAVKTYYHNGNLIKADTLPFIIADHINNNGADSAQSQFGNSELEKKYLSILLDDNQKPTFTTDSGVLYFVKIPHYEESDLKDWNDDVSSDELMHCFNLFINTNFNIDSIPDSLRQTLDELGVNLDDTDAESIISGLLDLGYDDYSERIEESGDDHEMIATSYYDLLDTWTHRAFGDYSFDPNHGDNDSDIDLIDSKYTDALVKFCQLLPQFHHDGFSLGDMLTALKHSISSLQPDISDKDAHRLVSEFASKKLNIAGYTAPAVAGEHGSQEVIIICERALKEAKIIEVSKFTSDELDDESALDI